MQRLVLACVLLVLAGAASADDAAKVQPGIYTCVDTQGKRHTSDRPIRECLGREHQVLNKDGSLRFVLPATLTAEERIEREARERRAAEQRNAIADATRRDRNLLGRYPDEAAHLRAREAALDTVRLGMKATELRLQELAQERKPLLSEAEFYQGRPLPPKLKQALETNDAAADAQRNASVNQEAELSRINRVYDTELNRLRRLWAGATPGTLGPLLMSQPAASPLATQRAATGSR